MKIAIVYPFFAHYRGPIIERLNNDKQIEFVFLGGTKTNPPFSSLKLFDFDKTYNFIPLRNFWFLKYFLWQPTLIKELRKGDFDGVIFLSDWKYLSIWPALFFLRAKKTPTWFWSHGILNERQDINNKIKYYFHTLFKEGGFLYSTRAKDLMSKRGYDAELSVIYNSLDYQKQLEVIKKLDAGSFTVISPIVSKPYVIFTGRLIPERNLELLFDAIKVLNEENLKLNALIIGEGPHATVLKRKAEEKDVAGNVVFFGACYDEAVIGFYFMNALACVFPGPIGLTIVHSMTYGTPVITNDNYGRQKPEVEALVPNVNGYLFEDGNLNSLVEMIKKSLFLSPEERNIMKMNAQRRIAENFTPEYQAQQIKKAIYKAIS